MSSTIFPTSLLQRFGFASIFASALYPVFMTLETYSHIPRLNLWELFPLAFIFQGIPAYIAMVVVGFPMLLLLVRFKWTNYLAFAITGALCLSLVYILVYLRTTFIGIFRNVTWLGGLQGIILWASFKDSTHVRSLPQTPIQ